MLIRKGLCKPGKLGRLPRQIAAAVLQLQLLSGAGSVLADEAEAGFYKGPPIVADVVNTNENFPELSFTNRMMVSQYGFRLETVPEKASEKPNLFIQNFTTDQAWLVDQSRKIHVELSEDDTEDGADDEEYVSGMITDSVCEGLEKKAIGTTSWRGFDVSIWDCSLDQRVVLRQYYSPYWRLVVREERADGVSSELQRIKKVDLDPKLFNPSADFRQTDLQELIRGVPKLQRYQNPNAGSNAVIENSISN